MLKEISQTVIKLDKIIKKNRGNIMSTLVDIGINLTHRKFQDDRVAVIQRAVENGVTQMIITGTSLKGSKDASVMAKNYPNVLYSTAGVHPHDAKHFTEHTKMELKKLAQQKHVVAIGECGLDFNRDFSPRNAQEECFKAQLELARETGKPLFLHERDAHQRFVAIMKDYQDLIPQSVVHCFTGNEAEVKDYVSLGFMIGITGWICDDKRGQELRKAVKHIPLDKLMIETDGPFLTPRDLTPKPKDGRNEPSFLPHIANAIADCMGVSVEEIIKSSTENAERFFRLSTK